MKTLIVEDLRVAFKYRETVWIRRQIVGFAVRLVRAPQKNDFGGQSSTVMDAECSHNHFGA